MLNVVLGAPRLRGLPLLLRLGASGALVLASFGLRGWLFGSSSVPPFTMFYPTVILSAALFGQAVGFFAVVLAGSLSLYFIPPFGSFRVDDPAGLVSVVLFLCVGSFIVLTIGALQRLHVTAEAARHQAEEARKAAEADRLRAEASERERSLLLEEFSHRVKNDLAQIAASLGIEARAARPDVASALQTAADRVRVLARVHSRLAQREGRLIVDVKAYLGDLLADLETTTARDRGVALRLRAEPHHASLSAASAIGLLVNELVTNAVKHAFPDRAGGTVDVAFRGDGDCLLLTVEDDGVGLRGSAGVPDAAPGALGSGQGRRLLRALAVQLGGTLEVRASERTGGVSVSVTMPAKLA